MKIFSFKQIMVIFVMLFSITYSLPTFFNEVPNWLTSINAKNEPWARFKRGSSLFNAS